MNANVIIHGVFGGRTVRTVGAHKGLFPCVSADVFCHAVLADCGIGTVGTLMDRADCFSPA